MSATGDFNYKVALASGAKSLQAGRLRQAEDQFRYLVAKFPAADGGYRGLAKVFMELDDSVSALGTLRDGAAALARAGDRTAAIAMLREAVLLDPQDASAHRRLFAALALSGDLRAASDEARRYADAAVAIGDPERARREIEYALARYSDVPDLRELAATLGGAPTAPGARTAVATAEPSDDEPLDIYALASQYISSRDPRAAEVALGAARDLLDSGRTDAASDLLLELIGAGLGDHDAQGMLLEVTRATGGDELARAKCALLARSLRLEGKHELALEFERLANAV